MSREGRSQPVQPYVTHGFLGNTPANGVLPPPPTIVDRVDQRARYAAPLTVTARRLSVSATFNDSGTCTITLAGTGSGSQTHSSSGTCALVLTGSGTGSQAHAGSGTCTITLAGSGVESHAHSASRTCPLTFGGTGVELYVPPPNGSVTGWVSQVLEFLHVSRSI